MKNKLQKWMEKKEQLTRDFEQLRVKAIKRKIYPYWDKFATPEYHRLLRKTNAAADAMLEGYFKYDLSREMFRTFQMKTLYNNYA